MSDLSLRLGHRFTRFGEHPDWSEGVYCRDCGTDNTNDACEEPGSERHARERYPSEYPSEPPTEPPADVLTTFLEGAPFAALGPDAEKRLRDELREIQAGIRVVIAGHDELRNLLKQANQLAGKLGVDAENAGRACFDEWDEDDFQLGYLVGIGDGFLRTSHLLSFLGNVLLVKTARIEAESAGGETA